MPSRILVTGATGLLGTHLVRKLVKDRKQVRIILREDSNHSIQEGLNVEIVRGDITKQDEMLDALKEVSFVYNCAGLISYLSKDSEKLHKINVDGTRNVLDAALKCGVKRVVHVSSTSALDRKGDYGKTKYLGEKECDKFISKGLDIMIARPATIYGVGDKKGNSAYSFQQVLHSNLIFVPPGGKSYVEVNDLVEGLLICMEKGKIGEKYVFSSEYLTYMQLYSSITKAANTRVKLVRIPKILKFPSLFLAWFTKYSAEAIHLGFDENRFSSKETIEKLDWIPTHSVKNIIPEMYNYYKKEGIII